MKDYLNYQGKICVVTGSSNGMGLATTKMLVDLGASVYAVSRSVTKVDGITASILCDLSKKEDIDKAFSELPTHIDCFFGVAGLSGSKTDLNIKRQTGLRLMLFRSAVLFFSPSCTQGILAELSEAPRP